MRQTEKKPDRFWDWMARRYDRQVQRNEKYTEAVERFSKYLRADDTVLDYACGPGVVTYKIAGAVKRVHAIDTSAKMIDIAEEGARERELANVHFERKSIFDENLRPESYDVILAFNILHLLEDAREALERASELLKPEGLLVSSTPCLRDAGVVPRTLFALLAGVLPLSHLRKLSSSDVKELVQRGGFEILESEVPERRLPICRVVARKR